jgi:hypothetical protein
VKIFRYILLLIGLFPITLIISQEKAYNIKHELEIGTTGHFYFRPDSPIRYTRIDKGPYLYTGGSKGGSAFILFIPYFSFHYTRYINDHAFSTGYTYFAFREFDKKENWENRFMSLKLGYQYKDIISAKWVSLRASISLHLNKSSAYKSDYFGNYLLNPDNQLPIYGVALGMGFTNKYYFKEKVFLSHNLEMVYNSTRPHFFLQHFIGLGYRF